MRPPNLNDFVTCPDAHFPFCRTLRGHTLLLFPRTTTPSPIRISRDLAREVRVKIATGYADPVPRLSSTSLRAALAVAAADAAPVEGVHPAVWRAAAAQSLYAPLPPSASRLHFCVFGPPGCGKTTICSELVRRTAGRMKHVSGGDFHRAACEALGPRYGSGMGLVQVKRDDAYGDELSRFIYGCHVTALTALGREGVMPKLRRIDVAAASFCYGVSENCKLREVCNKRRIVIDWWSGDTALRGGGD